MDRVAFVTGASYGLGAACALALAHDGFQVAVADVNPDDLADTVTKIAATGARAVPVAPRPPPAREHRGVDGQRARRLRPARRARQQTPASRWTGRLSR